MHYVWCVLVLCWSFAVRGALAQERNEVNAAQFLNLARSEYSKIEDIELVFEGESKRVDGSTDGSCAKFQGVFAARPRDDALYMDIYKRPVDDRMPFSHSTNALLKSVVHRIERWPDMGVIDPRPEVLRGRFSSLNELHTPLRFLLYSYIASIEDPVALGYEYLGWETIDGRNCLRVQFDEGIGFGKAANRPVIRFWFDVERAMQPVKVQFWRQGIVVGQTDHIELAEVLLPSKQTTWFPMSAQSYNGDPATSQTVTRTTAYIVKDTLRLNQDLPDRRFDIHWKSNVAPSQSYQSAEREFKKLSTPKSAPLKLTGSGDAKGVREILEERLAQADRQSKELEASSPAREFLGPTQYAMLAFVLGGILLLIGGVILKRRMS